MLPLIAHCSRRIEIFCVEIAASVFDVADHVGVLAKTQVAIEAVVNRFKVDLAVLWAVSEYNARGKT